jgi:hypothetical protein
LCEQCFGLSFGESIEDSTRLQCADGFQHLQGTEGSQPIPILPSRQSVEQLLDLSPCLLRWLLAQGVNLSGSSSLV